jgi:hypothetical protein
MAPREEEFFGPLGTGYLCSVQARPAILAYDFMIDPLCGHGS